MHGHDSPSAEELLAARADVDARIAALGGRRVPIEEVPLEVASSLLSAARRRSGILGPLPGATEHEPEK